MHYTDWHISILENNLSLGRAHASLKQVGAKKNDIPLIIKLVENPAYSIPGLTLFHGAVDLLTHDYIHILLGRGLLPADEAFTIGYTMGSTKQVSAVETALFEAISRYLYPDVYCFKEREITIFRAGLNIARASDGERLDQVDYGPLLEISLGEIRDRIGIATKRIIDYYRSEQKLYPDNKASCRLL